MANSIKVTLANNQPAIIVVSNIQRVYLDSNKTIIEYTNGKLDLVLESIDYIQKQINE